MACQPAPSWYASVGSAYARKVMPFHCPQRPCFSGRRTVQSISTDDALPRPAPLRGDRPCRGRRIFIFGVGVAQAPAFRRSDRHPDDVLDFAVSALAIDAVVRILTQQFERLRQQEVIAARNLVVRVEIEDELFRRFVGAVRPSRFLMDCRQALGRVELHREVVLRQAYGNFGGVRSRTAGCDECEREQNPTGQSHSSDRSAPVNSPGPISCPRPRR